MVFYPILQRLSLFDSPHESLVFNFILVENQFILFTSFRVDEILICTIRMNVKSLNFNLACQFRLIHQCGKMQFELIAHL